MIASTLITVDQEISAVGAARRVAAALAQNATLGAESAGKLALVVTELGTNLVKHADRGMLILRGLSAAEGGGVEVLSLDRGPGMRNVAECLRDGYSTGGTLGNGLGAVLRAATAFDVLSDLRSGTAIVARVQSADTREARECLGAICLPHPAESDWGDAWAVSVSGSEVRVVVVDGLGHGPLAQAASDALVRVFYANAHEDPAALVQRCHQHLRSTRGAVVGLAVLRRDTRAVTYCAVGNIAATLLEQTRRRGLTSQNGIVGHHLPALRVVTEPWDRDAALVLNSDGLSTRWALDGYPGILAKHPAIIAGVLYRDFARGNDDATVVVLRDRASP